MGFEGLSAHKATGWRAQATRLERWHRRLEAVASDPAASTEDRLDFFLTFCQNCYALRDWLEKDAAVSKNDLDQLMVGTYALRVCRDIANGSKHLTVTRPSVDANFSIGREYQGRGQPERWFVIAGTDLLDALALARDCRDAWNVFLGQHNLLS